MTDHEPAKRPYVPPAMPKVVGSAAAAENSPTGNYNYYADFTTYFVSN